MNNQEAIARLKNIINKTEADENSMCHVDSGDKKALEIGIQSIRTLRAIELINKKDIAKNADKKTDWRDTKWKMKVE